MEWEKNLIVGANFLNNNLTEVIKDGISLKLHKWSAHEKYNSSLMMRNNYHEVYYILNGKGYYSEDNHREEIKYGSLISITPQTNYQLESEKGIEFICVGFELLDSSHSFIHNIFSLIRKNHLYVMHDKENSAGVLIWLAILKLAALENTIYLKNNFDNLVITLFWCILKEFEQDILHQTSKPVQSSASNLIYKAKTYIIDHLNEAITLNDVANHLHISERHLSRLFSQELGQPFTTFIRKERIRKAGILLSNSDIPIKEIAEQTGFFSVHYFTNVFSKEMDMPPGKFRDKFRQIHAINKQEDV